jgi:hypothetical protein
MKRRLADILCILSLLLGAGVASLWMSSYSVADSFMHATSVSVNGVEQWHYRGVESTCGVLLLTDAALPPLPPDAHAETRGVGDTVTEYMFIMPLGYAHLRGTPTQYGTQFLGFSNTTRAGSQGSRLQRIGIPYWFLLTVTATPPFCYIVRRWLRRRQQTYRLNRGLCLTCGYDLQASKQRCPECGTAIPVQTGDG